MRILRAEHLYVAPLDQPSLLGQPLAALPALMIVNPFEGRPMLVDEQPTRKLRKRATAYVNHGRWVARCPTEGCGSSLVVSPADPRLLCPTCWKGYYPVDFPDDVDAIEAALGERPGELNRNWEPGETVQDLIAENAAARAEGRIE